MAKNKKAAKGNGAEKSIQPAKTASKPDATDLIGKQLRKYYDEVADQPVPTRFLHLLDKLDDAISSKKPK